MSFPLWCLFFAALMLVLTKAPVVVAMARSGEKGYDNSHPRAQQNALTGWGARAMAAHANMFEAFPLFAAAVLVVQVTGTIGTLANVLAGLFIVARILYTLLYLADRATLRSLVWGVGFISCLVMLLLPAMR
ncbi:MAPEG family protein [uncultured Pseudomonas sp.]|uniref:MAPEG family protein n=1 Tax=uncultured Pseudomonas sp. TaxID=114707 RepID=UPI0030DB924F|tara:strand:+ start:1520 stop:1915 length:396 start_codon:yes stop_codon:yes gene_type:complete